VTRPDEGTDGTLLDEGQSAGPSATKPAPTADPSPGSSTSTSEAAADDLDLPETTLRPLLLHSLSDMREIWLPLLEIAGVRSVAEVGTESGVTTQLLVRLLSRSGAGRLVVLDPDPGEAPESTGDLDVEVIRGFSPEALVGVAPTDAYLLDGDHNYWTVTQELEEIERSAVSDFPLVLMNDVSWPCARRDTYYNPERIPAQARHPFSFELGVTVGQEQASTGGFRGEGAFAVALLEGGPRNGVLTAVEDFLSTRPHLRFLRVAPVFGLGVLFDSRVPWAAAAETHLAPYAGSAFLERMERNRVELYLRVLQLQDLHAADRRARQREWARLDEERSALAVRELDMMERLAAAERAVHQAEARADRAEASAAAAASSAARRPGWLPSRS
jgi:hypothetical protein